MTVALVPMKDLGAAKERLSPVLSDSERKGLVYAMLRDVLAALDRADNIDRVAIVAHDRGYLDFGVDFIEEAVNRGYNEAIGFAMSTDALSDAEAVLILPGDIPMVSPSEINDLAASASPPCVRVAAARDGDGTNGLLLAPPDVVGTAFGPGSHLRHKEIAAAAGAIVQIVEGPGISFDIDTPDDLIAFCAVDGTTETHTFLDLSGIRGRLLAENA